MPTGTFRVRLVVKLLPLVVQTGCSVALDLAVERIALQRRAPGSADQPHHLVDVALVAHAGGGHHVLLDHRGAHVVGAEGEGHLPHLQALGDPRGLDAGHVVEVDAAHGEQAQVVEAGGGRVAGGKLRVAGLEGPGDERREAAGLVLQVADAAQVLDALDTPAERIEHLRRIRDLQDETGGFTAFIPWTFQAGNTELAAGHTPATGFDYLRLLAVSRIYLDNVPSIQASWVTQGLKMGQVALAFGANDMGSTMIEENVVAAAGVRNQCDVDEMVRLIRAAGRTPLQRDTLYGEVKRY